MGAIARQGMQPCREAQRHGVTARVGLAAPVEHDTPDDAVAVDSGIERAHQAGGEGRAQLLAEAGLGDEGISHGTHGRSPTCSIAGSLAGTAGDGSDVTGHHQGCPLISITPQAMRSPASPLGWLV